MFLSTQSLKKSFKKPGWECFRDSIPSQRTVITLHDVEGWTSEEICNVPGISETNQRVLLHLARSKVRRALEQYFDENEGM